MNTLTFAELADMHLMYGLAQGNATEARNLYAIKFPGRYVPDRRSFQNVDRMLRETGKLTQHRLGGRPLTNANTEEEVLNAFRADPSTSLRSISGALGLSTSTVWRTLNRNSMYPYHVQRVQGLTENDYGPRLNFCQWFMTHLERMPTFSETILFTDEAAFDRDGVMNFHNTHQWMEENPHAIVQKKHQQQFSCSVWGGIINNTLVGPHFFENRLNGQMYVEFLRNELNQLLEDVPLNIRCNMWFMHDGAPAHFSRIARQELEYKFGQQWIGRGGPVGWPPRSPDLNPCDFYLWGHLKSLVYRQPVNNINELKAKISNEFENIRQKPEVFQKIRDSLEKRIRACIFANGGHFEHLI